MRCLNQATKHFIFFNNILFANDTLERLILLSFETFVILFSFETFVIIEKIHRINITLNISFSQDINANT